MTWWERLSALIFNNESAAFMCNAINPECEADPSNKKKIIDRCERINTKDAISDDESPLAAAKRGKESSMWKSIESQKEKIFSR